MFSLLNKIKERRASDVSSVNSTSSLSGDTSTSTSKKLRSPTGLSTADSSSADENILTDDQDVFRSTTGTLMFTDESAKTPTDSDLHYVVPCEGNYNDHVSVSFEVISAEVVKEGRSGHVNYTILINPHRDSRKTPPTVIIRRYSDFETLHHVLKKRFGSLLSSVSFPRKIFSGNFTSGTIAKRSTAFEQFLTHLFSYFEVRYSSEFLDFFVQGDFRKAKEEFLAGHFGLAAPLFEKTLPVVEKLYGNFHPYVCQCLCALVICYISLDKQLVAHTCAQMALKCCEPEGSGAGEELRCALLVTAVRLCWILGKEKMELEKKLQVLRDNGVDVDAMEDLKDMLASTFQLRRW